MSAPPDVTDWSWLGGLAAGSAMGLVISALGAGGSLFIVPVLLFFFHEPVAVATGTSLAVVSAAAAVGALSHARRGNVKLKVALAFGAASMATAPLGAFLHPLISDRASVGLFAAVLVAAGARMLLGAPAPHESPKDHKLLTLLPLGAAVGLLTGFLGVGGGFVIVPALTWGARLSVKHAVGTSLCIIAVTSLTGASGYAAKGLLSVPLLMSIGAGAMAGALLGAPLSHHLPDKPIRYGFAAMSFAVAIYMLVRAFRG